MICRAGRYGRCTICNDSALKVAYHHSFTKLGPLRLSLMPLDPQGVSAVQAKLPRPPREAPREEWMTSETQVSSRSICVI